jgi:hypothetical protein
MPKKKRTVDEQDKYVRDSLYRDLLEIEREFGDITFNVIDPDEKVTDFNSMVDAVEFIKNTGGMIQVIQEESGKLLYEAEIEIDWK